MAGALYGFSRYAQPTQQPIGVSLANAPAINSRTLLEVIRDVAPFAKSPQQWLTQMHMQMGWEMLQFNHHETKWQDLFYGREQGQAVEHRRD